MKKLLAVIVLLAMLVMVAPRQASAWTYPGTLPQTVVDVNAGDTATVSFPYDATGVVYAIGQTNPSCTQITAVNGNTLHVTGVTAGCTNDVLLRFIHGARYIAYEEMVVNVH